MLTRKFLAPAMALSLLACSDDNPATPGTPDSPAKTFDAPPPDATATTTVTVHPNDDVQAALINATPFTTIVFASGTYLFTNQLTLTQSNVTLKGQSGNRDDVILDFSGQTTGSPNGLSVTGASNFTVQDLSVRDTKGDSIRIQGADSAHLAENIVVRNVKVFFSAGPDPHNPGYAIYPTVVRNVLIEDCDVSGVTDSGIYVGQSENIVVRNNTVHENVNGIEIENSMGAEVMNNTSTNNIAGMLVFNLPHLTVTTGKNTVVHDNMFIANNHDVALSSMNSGVASKVPSGTGMIVLAADDTEVRDNTFTNNTSVGVAVISCDVLTVLVNDPNYCMDTGYDTFVDGTNVHDNTFSGNAQAPQGFYLAFGSTLFDIIWDGVADPKSDPNGDLKLCVRNNTDGSGAASYARLDLNFVNPPNTADLANHDCTHAAVPSIDVTWGN